MKPNKLELRSLRPEDKETFINAVAAFEKEQPAFEFAFDFDASASFIEYIKKLERWSLGKELPDKFVPNTFFVGVVEHEIVGRLSLRHHLNDFLARIGGHIGYGVIPAHRKKGYATEMLKQALPVCTSLGIDNVLITCDIDNLGSQKVIEGCGGIFENTTNDPLLKVQKKRYWLNVSE
ncbi:GNAT family N-acetyltransferase [Desulfocicer niacini]